jgi:hypothetical protein
MRKIPTLSTLVSLLLLGVGLSERANAVGQEFSCPVAQAFVQGSGMCAFAIMTGANEPATSSPILPQEAQCGAWQMALVAAPAHQAAEGVSNLRGVFFFVTAASGTFRDAFQNIATWLPRC